MFCKNCGKEIAENVKFCSYCGCENSISNNSQSGATEVTTEQKATTVKEIPKKKIANILIVLIAIIVGGFIGKAVIAPSLTSNPGGSTSQNEITNKYNADDQNEVTNNYNTDDSQKEETETINPEYSAIFTNHHIVAMDNLFIGLESSVYAMEYDSGMIEKMELAYDGDTVKELVSTLYVPVSGYSDDEIKTIETQLKSSLATYQKLSCCDITYSQINGYYVATITMKNLDDENNVREVASTDLLVNATGATTISKAQSEAGLLDSGFVKKYVEV